MDDKEWLKSATRHDLWDVVVLGAGPAGAIAARQFALQGHRVLLVEKSQFPRFKVCGGCLGGAALDVLEDLGLGDLPTKCGGVPLQSIRLASGGSVAEIEIGRRIAVSRQTFDAALVEEAIHSGTVLCTETTGSLHLSADLHARSVMLRCRERAIVVRTKAVMVATGLAPCPPDFLVRASPKSRIGLGAILEHSLGYDEPGVLHMACGAEGYVGIAQVEEGRLDIAAAVDPAALAAAGSAGKLVSNILSDSGLPMFADLGAASWRGTPLLTRQTEPLGSNRCLIVGDAARYVEPFTGEGIGWAMQSAVLACALMTKGLDEWDAGLPDRWRKLHDQTFSRHQRQCRLIVRLMRSKTIRSVALWSLRRAPNLARPIVRQLDHLR
jgi:menaquinone-9 beta-reductase